MDEGHFRAIKPEALFHHFNYDEVIKFSEELEGIIHDPQFKKFRERNKISLPSKGRDNKMPVDFVRIHQDKVSLQLFELLENEGLVRREENIDWIWFEHNTALLYMSLLAKYLADIDTEHTTIGTDVGAYEQFNFKRVSKDKGFPVVSCNLSNVLPTPREDVPLKKIIKFKRKRKDNLLRFNKKLSDFQSKLSKSESRAELKETTYNFQNELKTGVNDLVAVLGDSKIDCTLKTFRSMINIKTPGIFGATGLASAAVIGGVSIPLGLGLAAGIQLGANYIDLRNKQRAALRKEPFSYVYYARKSGIINKT